jgi:SpoVK/Ycf46/Vps4 family AAA+-type ATPase
VSDVCICVCLRYCVCVFIFAFAIIKIWQIDLGLIARSASGYSGAELELLCREAAMYGLRELFDMADDLTTLSVTASVRSVVLASIFERFVSALYLAQASVIIRK